MGQTATLKKISVQLNLSISTVSRALKNHPDISENTRRKVKELAALMEYEPNSYAVTLRTNKSRVFGLIVPAISNMFYDSFISAAEKDARKSGYSLLILQSGDDPVQEAENLRLCRHYRVDGILISVAAESHSTELFVKYQEAGIPLVFFDKVPGSGSFDTVCMADEEVATLAANTIIKYRKKRVLALFGNPDISITKKRTEAFLKTFEPERGIVQLILKNCRSSSEAEAAVTSSLSVKEKPDHVFCMSDEILTGAMKALHQSGLSIPKDISVLAISNGFLPGLFNPSITYLETSGAGLGKLAMKRMLERADGDSTARSIILPSRLVAGGSM
ncbi:MAG: LacI family DNA-binding transcriptional regulator [Bacteroidota bacterium]